MELIHKITSRSLKDLAQSLCVEFNGQVTELWKPPHYGFQVVVGDVPSSLDETKIRMLRVVHAANFIPQSQNLFPASFEDHAQFYVMNDHELMVCIDLATEGNKPVLNVECSR